ncbi:hypothetical protein HGRIS_005184 [Hohenbuehelia grisea]|uniref:Uncharacterized protein n=1 Tax=Hohenbuehelia grisea TaxID=104357 RepID=A0ABR3JEX8_9AGAR
MDSDSTDSNSTNIGGTLTDGIQDVSAILPLLGTEQCEKHVGSALADGYLYVTAAPLSIFGSLGIVLAGVKALAASFNIIRTKHKFIGAQKLDHAGFGPAGKALRQVLWKDKCHCAEKELTERLEELHIAENVGNLTVTADCKAWNWYMYGFSIIAAILGFTPYIFFIHHNKLPPFLRYFFPLQRIIGCILISTTTQLVVQTRLLEIIKHRLAFLTLDRFIRDNDINLSEWWEASSEWWNAETPSESALYDLGRHLRDILDRDKMTISQAAGTENTPNPPDPEKGQNPTPSPKPVDTQRKQQELKLHLSKQRLSDNSMAHFFHVCLIALGVAFSVEGYVGCFTLVKGTSVDSGAVLWLGIEVALSLIRMGLWSWNPGWDGENYNFLRFELELDPRSPLLTCNRYSEELDDDKIIPLKRARNFLADVTSRVGLLKPLEGLAMGVTLFYTLTRSEERSQWVLYVTISDYQERTLLTLRIVAVVRPPSAATDSTDSHSLTRVQRLTNGFRALLKFGNMSNSAADSAQGSDVGTEVHFSESEKKWYTAKKFVMVGAKDDIGLTHVQLDQLEASSMQDHHITQNKVFVRQLEEHCDSILHKLYNTTYSSAPSAVAESPATLAPSSAARTLTPVAAAVDAPTPVASSPIAGAPVSIAEVPAPAAPVAIMQDLTLVASSAAVDAPAPVASSPIAGVPVSVAEVPAPAAPVATTQDLTLVASSAAVKSPTPVRSNAATPVASNPVAEGPTSAINVPPGIHVTKQGKTVEIEMTWALKWNQRNDKRCGSGVLSEVEREYLHIGKLEQGFREFYEQRHKWVNEYLEITQKSLRTLAEVPPASRFEKPERQYELARCAGHVVELQLLREWGEMERITVQSTKKLEDILLERRKGMEREGDEANRLKGGMLPYLAANAVSRVHAERERAKKRLARYREEALKRNTERDIGVDEADNILVAIAAIEKWITDQWNHLVDDTQDQMRKPLAQPSLPNDLDSSPQNPQAKEDASGLKGLMRRKEWDWVSAMYWLRQIAEVHYSDADWGDHIQRLEAMLHERWRRMQMRVHDERSTMEKWLAEVRKTRGDSVLDDKAMTRLARFRLAFDFGSGFSHVHLKEKDDISDITTALKYTCTDTAVSIIDCGDLRFEDNIKIIESLQKYHYVTLILVKPTSREEERGLLQALKAHPNILSIFLRSKSKSYEVDHLAIQNLIDKNRSKAGAYLKSSASNKGGPLMRVYYNTLNLPDMMRWLVLDTSSSDHCTIAILFTVPTGDLQLTLRLRCDMRSDVEVVTCLVDVVDERCREHDEQSSIFWTIDHDSSDSRDAILTAGINDIAIPTIRDSSHDKTPIHRLTLKSSSFVNVHLVWTKPGHASTVTSIAFSPKLEDARIASGSDDGTIRLWNLTTGKQLAIFKIKGHKNKIKSVAFSPDGTRIASGSDDGTIRIWDAKDDSETTVGHQVGEPLKWPDHNSEVESVAFSPDGTRIASVSNAVVYIWDVNQGQGGEPLEPLILPVTATSVAFLPTFPSITALTVADEIIDISWDVTDVTDVTTSVRPIRLVEPVGYRNKSSLIAVSPDGKRIASVSQDQPLTIWDTTTGEQLVATDDNAVNPTSLSFSSDGTRIASASKDCMIRVWDATTAKLLKKFQGHEMEATTIAFSPDDKYIASGSVDASIRIWDANTYERKMEMKFEEIVLP